MINAMPKDFSIYDTEFTSSAGVGGRISSPKLRKSLEMAEDFTGLEQDTKRYDLLVLVKRVGKAAGFTARMTELLDYYMAFTRDVDWEQGSRPIVYQSLAKTALDLGVSERQVQRLEQLLFEAGALTWNDSGNHRRYGQRDPQSGKILYAFGVDLTPLAYLQSALQAKLEEKQLYDQAWLKTKRDISGARRSIKALIAELELEEQGTQDYDSAYKRICQPIRTYMDLQSLRELLGKHKELLNTLYDAINTHKEQEVTDSNDSRMASKASCKDDIEVINYNTSTHKLINKLNTPISDSSCSDKRNSFQEQVTDDGEPKMQSYEGSERPEKAKVLYGSKEHDKEALILNTGLQHITLKQALNACSDRFRAQIPLKDNALSWDDMIETAYKLKSELHVSQKSWAQACELLGRTGAAICLLLTDQATIREENRVLKPGAYFNAMINRARAGDLHLHNSIFGLLERDQA